jgi:hypothetical protein
MRTATASVLLAAGVAVQQAAATVSRAPTILMEISY